MIVKVIAGLLIVLGLLVLLRLSLLSVSSEAPPGLGLPGGRLAPCPKKPNCVSSLSKGKTHGISPISTPGPPENAMRRAREALSAIHGGQVVEVEEGYLRAEFISRIFRFVDDLELQWNPAAGHFEVRSASRVGTSDLGVNRRRVEELRRRLERPPSPEDRSHSS